MRPISAPIERQASMCVCVCLACVCVRACVSNEVEAARKAQCEKRLESPSTHIKAPPPTQAELGKQVCTASVEPHADRPTSILRPTRITVSQGTRTHPYTSSYNSAGTQNNYCVILIGDSRVGVYRVQHPHPPSPSLKPPQCVCEVVATAFLIWVEGPRAR